MKTFLLKFSLILSFCLPSAYASYWSAVVIPEDQALHQLQEGAKNTLEEKEEIQILVWNIFKKGRDSFDREYSLFKDSYQPDITLFQEALIDGSSSVCLEESDCVFSSAFTYDDIYSGVMTSSKLPIIDSFALHSDSLEPILNTPKTSLVNVIDFNGHEVMMINTHGINFVTVAAYQIQIDEIVAKASSFEGPILWAGDFNSWAIGRKMILDRALKDLGMERVAFKDDHLIKKALGLKLDHVFTRGFHVTNAHVLDTDGSDHRPLFLKLKLKP